jgi:hypothetical protein
VRLRLAEQVIGRLNTVEKYQHVCGSYKALQEKDSCSSQMKLQSYGSENMNW